MPMIYNSFMNNHAWDVPPPEQLQESLEAFSKITGFALSDDVLSRLEKYSQTGKRELFFGVFSTDLKTDRIELVNSDPHHASRTGKSQ